MNIESLISKIVLFNDLVIKSGFKRDLSDFVQSIQQGQNQNLVFMKDLSNRVKNKLKDFESYGLDSELRLVLKENKPFTELKTLDLLEELDQNTEIDGNSYFSKFNQHLAKLIQHIDNNKSEIDDVMLVFQKYVSENDLASESEHALVSLIFKDLKSTGSLKEFAKALNRWNRMLLIYHTLLTSNSPEEIELIEIQNGSIDVIFNVDLNIALDLTELIKIGLKVYGAYLLYKSNTAKVIIESYMGNIRLIKQEKDREILMLENIKDSISRKIIEQHQERIKIDKKIEKTSIDIKVEEVSSVITDHIIKGNELKLLTPPEINDDDEEIDISLELREETARVREVFKKISTEDRKLLLEKYSIKDDNE